MPENVTCNELDRLVTYEDFGAIGDGVTDDLPAICAAHAYANAHRSRQSMTLPTTLARRRSPP